jgi:hypothetical protein
MQLFFSFLTSFLAFSVLVSFLTVLVFVLRLAKETAPTQTMEMSMADSFFIRARFYISYEVSGIGALFFLPRGRKSAEVAQRPAAVPPRYSCSTI